MALLLAIGRASHNKDGISSMIVDTIENAARYYSVRKGFKTAFEFLLKADVPALDDGRYPIDGEKVFALLARGQGKGQDAAALEAHRKYIDIQYLAAGSDLIGIRGARDCRTVAKEYDADKDVIFFADRPDGWIRLLPGSFCILFPEDAHAPLAGDEQLTKIVVKIAVDSDG